MVQPAARPEPDPAPPRSSPPKVTSVAEWRLLRGFRPEEIDRRLAALADLPVTAALGNTGARYYSEALVGREPPGPPRPDGAFQRARELVARYDFSDPRIVVGHFDHTAPLLGRRMLLEIRVLGLRYLCGVVVGAVRDERADGSSWWGYRYDTLAGHIEAGAEWFLLDKRHDTGEVRFRIQASWREGQFPNWWSRAGFALLARRYQRAWHRLAYLRLRQRLQSRDLPPLPPRERILRAGDPLPAPPIPVLSGQTPPREVQLEKEKVAEKVAKHLEEDPEDRARPRRSPSTEPERGEGP